MVVLFQLQSLPRRARRLLTRALRRATPDPVVALLLAFLAAKLIDQVTAAEYLQITPRSVRNLIARGDLTAYRIRGLRSVRVDSDEVKALLSVLPTALPRRRVAKPKPEPRIMGGPNAKVYAAVTDVEGRVVGRTPLSERAKSEAVNGGVGE